MYCQGKLMMFITPHIILFVLFTVVLLLFWVWGVSAFLSSSVYKNMSYLTITVTLSSINFTFLSARTVKFKTVTLFWSEAEPSGLWNEEATDAPRRAVATASTCAAPTVPPRTKLSRILSSETLRRLLWETSLMPVAVRMQQVAADLSEDSSVILTSPLSLLILML